MIRILRHYKIFVFIVMASTGFAQQININRIELMPNHPAPYLMRDWKQVAMGYDSLVFNDQLTGTYLPLISFYNNTVNYPQHGSFKLNTVVGTTSPGSTEAINAIPAVIGATLVGIDKSNQNGRNFALMCEEFFNRRPEENIYLNHSVSSSGDDWWYETMPNVFFYQLNDLYPGTGDFENQFITIADRWLSAVHAMGGSASPWTRPNMNYRAWEFSTMKPLAQGVIEPEAAGAIAWILYNAYVQTGLDKYRIGAEWCMEFLSFLASNPSYEIQLPYGVLTAARMNAEIGTDYNIERLINWCFNNYSLRNWGSIVGNWGGYDVNGLIGEAYNDNNNDYAFLMNTLEQAGALVPLVRYDDRFARAIGKWVLNAANSARLFYTNYLPDDYQDSEQWSHLYDPNSYIGHESLKEFKEARSPYATGDAISGGWGNTNLALYGSSHVGIFGSIIETTNVEQILRLDLRKTDYYNHSGYPTYLYFNPYSEVKNVELYTGSGQYDLYDLVSNTFLKRNVSGQTTVDVPADAAVVIAITPAGGTLTYSLDKTLINGIVVDYRSGQTFNSPPRIKSIAAAPELITIQDTAKVYCTADDNNNDSLTYNWSTTGGSISGTGPVVDFNAPVKGPYSIICTVGDGKGGTAVDTLIIDVAGRRNTAPLINYLKAVPRKINIDSTAEISCSAADADGDVLTYSWSSESGSFSGDGEKVKWTAPSTPGNYVIYCAVTDRIAEVRDSIAVEVRDFSQIQTGSLMLFLPFNENAVDESGNGNKVTVYQAYAVPDRFSKPEQAFFFDGADDNVIVKNTIPLNFQRSISINFWMKISSFFQREAYPISHGNWENRWKISITNKKIRWTIKTNSGITDLDSETELLTDSLYNVSVSYDGSDVEIFINGQLDAFKKWQGSLSQTNYDLIIGQCLPANYNYGFRGILDDIRIFDYAISMEQIKSFDDYPPVKDTTVHRDSLPAGFALLQNFPNPFSSSTVIEFSIPSDGGTKVLISLFDVLGNEAARLTDRYYEPGNYRIHFDNKDYDLSSGIYFYKMTTDKFSGIKKMVLLR